jgi:Transposase, Mutator family
MAETKMTAEEVVGYPLEGEGLDFPEESLLWVVQQLTLFNAESGGLARELLGEALERLRKPLPRVAALLEEAEEDLLAFFAFPPDHWPKLRSTNPLERVNREIGRHTECRWHRPQRPSPDPGSPPASSSSKRRCLRLGGCCPPGQ